MARPKKTGLDFAPWDVHILEDDTKIDALIDAQGYGAFSIYFYLCQKAYATNGYFYRWSLLDSATTARRLGGGCRSETVKQVVVKCLQIGLFDKRLFDRMEILTSKGIQRRYAQAIQKRTSREVDYNIWLLDSEESEGLVVVPENRVFSPKTPVFSPETAQKVKESIYSSSSTAQSTEFSTVSTIPTLSDAVEYAQSLGQSEDFAQRFFRYYTATGWKTKSGVPIVDWQDTMRHWAMGEEQAKCERQSKKAKNKLPVSENAAAYESFIYNQ